MPVRNLAIIIFTVFLSLWCYSKADHEGYAASVADAMMKIRLFYVEDVDSRDLFESAMNGMVEGALDRYSSYISPDSFRQMEESLDQEFGGVGIEIEKPDGEPLMVLSPLFGAPAYEQGLRAGDEILSIDGEETAEMSQTEAVDRMRGAPGSPVKLTVRHAGEEEVFEATVVREVIVVQSVLGDKRRDDGSWDFHLQRDPRIGYLRLTTFGKHTVEEIRELLADEANQDFQALLIDLRSNAGGLLSAAVETCDLFIDQGRIVSTRGRDDAIGREYDATSPTAVDARLPVVVLVNRFSASASEIMAACLQDHERAIVVGERTWGKGTVQNILEMEGGASALRLTTATYWRPSGENIHRSKDAEEDDAWGVRPNEGYEVMFEDEEMRLVNERRRDRDIGRESEPAAELLPADRQPVESTDRQLEKAFEYLENLLSGTQPAARRA